MGPRLSELAHRGQRVSGGGIHGPPFNRSLYLYLFPRLISKETNTCVSVDVELKRRTLFMIAMQYIAEVYIQPAGLAVKFILPRAENQIASQVHSSIYCLRKSSDFCL